VEKKTADQIDLHRVERVICNVWYGGIQAHFLILELWGMPGKINLPRTRCN